jgi:hypothetical protein
MARWQIARQYRLDALFDAGGVMMSLWTGSSRKALIFGVTGLSFLMAAALRGADAPATMPTTAPSNQLATATTAPSTTRPNQNASAPPATQPDVAVAPVIQPSPEILAIVEQLGGDDFAARQAAQKKLVELGSPALPQLRALLHTDLNDEAHARVQSAIAQIQEAEILGPAFITLHYSNAPLQDVLDDFARQAGADMGVRRPQILAYAKTRKASIDVQHASFWEALRIIGDASGLHPRPAYGSNAKMTLDIAANNMPFDMFGDFAQSFGPFMIVPQTCQLNRIVQYTRGAASQSNLTLQMLAMVEPKIHIMGQNNADWMTECVDDKGHSLINTGQPSYFFNNGRQGWWWQLACNLKEVPDLGAKITRLRGELKFKVETKSEVVTFDDLSKIKDVTRTINGTTITLKSFIEQNGVYELHASLTGAAAGNNNWNMIQDVIATISVLSADDEIISQQSMSSSGSPDSMEVTLQYPSSAAPNIGPRGPRGLVAVGAGMAPHKLRWDVPLETKMLSVPFELNNLGLPLAP